MYFEFAMRDFQKMDKVELSSCAKNCVSKIENGKLRCDCGNDIHIFEWCWKKDVNSSNCLLDYHDLEVTFNPVYSSGTAVIKGCNYFQKNAHYYWEIKIITNLYGTDVMVGVGTEKIPDYRHLFCSMLGIDEQSWGYSYRGIIQHNKLTRKYGSNFGLGCIVGVHLDMYKGELEYYLNRKPLGTAFDGLKDKKLLPMACSTAAQSSMRLNCAISQEETLQMLCLKCVQQHSSLYEKYRSIPGLNRYYDRKYFWMVPKDFEEVNQEEEDEKLHMISFENTKKSCKNDLKKRSSNNTWDNANKKVNIDKNETESSSSAHFISNPTCLDGENLNPDSDKETRDICMLAYEWFSDISSNSDSDAISEVD